MASIAELLNYKEQQHNNTVEQSITQQKTLTESQQQAIDELNESVRVCRLETQKKADEKRRNEKIKKNALSSLRTLRRDRDSIIQDLRHLTQWVDEYVNDLRLDVEIELSNSTHLRNNKIVANPGKKDRVTELKHSLETDFVAERSTCTTPSGDTLKTLREKLHTVNNRLDYFMNILRGDSPRRSLPPRVERDRCVVRLIPLVNDESLWTEENEADLAETYQSLTNRVTELNERVRPRGGYPAPPTVSLSVLYGIETDKTPRGTLDVSRMRNELTGLVTHHNTLYDTEGDTERVDSVCNHLEYLARKIGFLTTNYHIIKRGRHYYMMNPAPSGTRS